MDINLYALKNSDGQWFRAKGRSGYGKSWADDIKKARIYNKIGSARTQITYFANHYPAFPPPTLIKLIVSKIEEIDETERIETAMRKKEIARAKIVMKNKEYALKRAQEQLSEAKKVIKELK